MTTESKAPVPVETPVEAPAACCGEVNTPVEEAGCCSAAAVNGAPTADGFSGALPATNWSWLAAGAFAFAGAAVLAFLILPAAAFDKLSGEIWKNIAFVANQIWEILPYVLISVSASAWATVSGFSEKIRAVFTRQEKVAVAGAALAGATVPFCACGVLPLIAAMLTGGVPLAPIMAFWISSPLMSPEMFLLTSGTLGVDYAAGRLAAAILLGAGSGYMVSALISRGYLQNQLRGLAQADSCCGPAPEVSFSGVSYQPTRLRRFFVEAGGVSLFLGKWLTLAFIIEAVIVHYVDQSWISAALGGDQPFAIPLATAIGIPLYTSGVASIPITQGLVSSGMSPGAAMAFLVAGPVTTIPCMMTVWVMVKKPLFFYYLSVGIVGALLAGYLFQAVMS